MVLKKIKKMIPKREEKLFLPSCKIDMERGEIVCEPIIKKGGIEYGSPRPMIFKIEEKGRVLIVDDGGATPELIDKVIKHIEKHVLE